MSNYRDDDRDYDPSMELPPLDERPEPVATGHSCAMPRGSKDISTANQLLMMLETNPEYKVFDTGRVGNYHHRYLMKSTIDRRAKVYSVDGRAVAMLWGYVPKLGGFRLNCYDKERFIPAKKIIHIGRRGNVIREVPVPEAQECPYCLAEAKGIEIAQGIGNPHKVHRVVATTARRGAGSRGRKTSLGGRSLPLASRLVQ